MFGRVHRAALAACPNTPIEAYGLLHAYSPATVASTIAAGMGAGAMMAGSATVTLPDGRHVSAVAEALDSVQRAGRNAQHRYVTLPGHILVIVTPQDVRIWRWNTASTLGEQVALWAKGSYTATEVKYTDQSGVRVVLDSGLIAILTGTAGYPLVEQTISAISSLARR
jgi:hypothetical protein